MKTIYDRLDEIRNSFGDYCVNVCKSKCCQTGKLLLQNEDELELIADGKLSEFAKDGIITKNFENGNYYFDLENNSCGSCHFLGDDFLCGVYKKKGRPRVCKDYPIFKAGEFIITANNCPAIVSGLVDDKLDELKKEFNVKIV